MSNKNTINNTLTNDIQQYIKQKMLHWVEKYPHIRLYYTFDSRCNDHTIQIAPSTFIQSSEWKFEYLSLFKATYLQYPNHLIGFIEEDEDIAKYEDTIFQTQGILYGTDVEKIALSKTFYNINEVKRPVDATVFVTTKQPVFTLQSITIVSNSSLLLAA